VDSLMIKNLVIADNGQNLILETFPDFRTEIILRFENIPVYNSRFAIRIKPGIQDSTGNSSENEYIFKIFADGKYSKPPEFAGIRIPMAPDNEIDQELFFCSSDSLYKIIPITDENYPSGENIKTWIELYFITAQGASIDLFSLMELFRIDTSNNVISFSPRQIKTSDFSINEPQLGWENYQRIEVAGIFVNSVNFGIINFQIAAGLKDSLGNRNEKSLNISLIK